MINTQQECFDIIYKYAEETSVQSGPRTEFPAVFGKYRDKYGNKCFIGILIDDDVYEPYMEGKSVADTLIVDKLLQSGMDVDAVGIHFLSRIQTIHDTQAPIFWTAYLEKLASDYNLNVRKTTNGKETSAPDRE